MQLRFVFDPHLQFGHYVCLLLFLVFPNKAFIQLAQNPNFKTTGLTIYLINDVQKGQIRTNMTTVLFHNDSDYTVSETLTYKVTTAVITAQNSKYKMI